MNARNIRTLLTVNAGQYKRLKKIEKRSRKLLGYYQPADFILSEYLQPAAKFYIEEALTRAEKDLDEMETLTMDPFTDEAE